MKQVATALALLAGLATTADAACTKKSLNGTWSVSVGGQAVTGVMAGGTVSVDFGGTPVIITVSSFNKDKCKGTGTISVGGVPGAATFASEQISTSSSRKPNHLMGSVPIGMGIDYEFIMHRK